ncbi:MAG TPA: AI-2E family transporter [Pyrinomonadaceae bacterium]|nr:AI-2E family transporter [Pyrinomonadaceae bacterium]
MAEWAEPRGRQVRWFGLLAATVVALYLCWSMLQPFIEVVLWAVVLVIVFFPVHRRIQARVKSPGWSAVLSCLLVIFVILVPLTLLTFAVVNEVGNFAQMLQPKPDGTGGAAGTAAGLLDPNHPYLGPAVRWVGQYYDVSKLASQGFIAERLKGVSGAVASRTLGFVGGAVGFIVEVFFVIFTMYYLFRDGERLRAAAYDMMPLSGPQAREILDRTGEVIGASVYGVLVIAIIQGVLGGLAFWVLGLPSPLLWGVVMIFLSMIPMLGAFIVWVPAAIYLVLTGDWVKAIILAVWGALVIGSVDNFLRPKLVGERTRLHELLVFFSVLGGLQVFGVLGIVLGPVIVAITIALLDVLRHADGPRREVGGSDTLLEEQAELRAAPKES